MKIRISTVFLGLLFLTSWFAQQSVDIKIDWNTQSVILMPQVESWNSQSGLTMKQFLITYFNYIGQDLPSSYRFVSLNVKWAVRGTYFYEALQKGIFMGLLDSNSGNINGNSIVTEGIMAALVKRNFGIVLSVEKNVPLTKIRMSNLLRSVPTYFEFQAGKIGYGQAYSVNTIWNFPVFDDVYQKLKNNHYDALSFDDKTLVQGAIKWLTEATKDPYTTYFPPTEAKNFTDNLNGQFEWIWAYVDMSKPGELVVLSPISGGPAEKAGIKWGDRIKKIGDYLVDEKTRLEDAVSKIKGPADTTVVLTILRWSQEIIISVVRAKVKINFVESQKLDNGDFYIKINTFGYWVDSEFEKAIAEMLKVWANKLILDVRNNPGGSLEEVSQMLDLFVPKWQPSVVIKSRAGDQIISSEGSDLRLSSQQKVVVLINEWSASASEIMAGTMKDYVAGLVLVGQKTFGKGSVQILEEYIDGSSIKYTISKWFTGKSQTTVDHVGLKPDILITEDLKTTADEQLDYAKTIR